MKTLAILQNQWGPKAHDPDYPSRLARLESLTPEAYADHVRRCLAWSRCRTYQRLVKEFGEAAFASISWTNASRNAGATASSKFAPSASHLDATLRALRPDVVIAFGKVAAEGIEAWVRTPESTSISFELILAPHPVARHSGAGDELRAAVSMWRQAARWPGA